MLYNELKCGVIELKKSKIVAIIISSVVSVIFLCVFVYFTYLLFADVSMRINFWVMLISIVLLVIPLLESIKNLKLLINDKQKVAKTIFYEIGLIPLSLFYYFIVIFIIGAISAAIPIKNPNQYKKIYNAYKNSELISYYPNNIPKDAYDIKFYFHPAFMQGNAVMNLYYKANDKTINEYIDKYEKVKTDKIANAEELYLDDDIKITSDYKKYFLYSYCDNSGYCNHGSYSMVAINDKTNECIFALEEW